MTTLPRFRLPAARLRDWRRKHEAAGTWTKQVLPRLTSLGHLVRASFTSQLVLTRTIARRRALAKMLGGKEADALDLDVRLLPSNFEVVLEELIKNEDEKLLALFCQFEQESGGKEDEDAHLDGSGESSAAGLFTWRADVLVHNTIQLVLGVIQPRWRMLFTDFSSVHAKRLVQERLALPGDAPGQGNMELSLVYGETSFMALATTLVRILDLTPGVVSGGLDGGLGAGSKAEGPGPVQRTGAFYDLGHGTGRGVMAALLLHRFSRVVGVELLDELYEVSETVLERCRETAPEVLDGVEVELIKGDLRDVDFSDALVVFANSTAFDMDLMRVLAQRGEACLQPGAYFITTSHALDLPAFEVIDRRQHAMSWGMASVYVHMRVSSTPRGTS